MCVYSVSLSCTSNPAPTAGPSSEFHYLNQGQSVRIGGTDDYKDFFTTSEALGMVGISTNLKKEVFAVLAAILHLGNVEIIENDRESCDIDVRIIIILFKCCTSWYVYYIHISSDVMSSIIVSSCAVT